SDMLVDFVSVMVDNQKPREYVTAQLLDCELNGINVLVTNEQEANALTDWLFEWIAKNDVEGQRMSTLPPPAPRAFQMALNQATSNQASRTESTSVDMMDVEPVHQRKNDLRLRLK